MTTNVSLTAELERFARECVESGRFNNVSEVVRSALRMMQEREERRAKFNAMLDAVEAESDRNGAVPADEVLAEARAIVQRHKASRSS